MDEKTSENARVILTHEVLKVATITALVEHAAAGALTTFGGVVRDNAQFAGQNRRVAYLEYSAYEAMARRELEKVWAQVEAKWPVRCAVAHRLGRLEIGEMSVFIAVAGGHRGEAFEACRWAIDEIKRTVPIWKKEVGTDGVWWVEDPTQNRISAAEEAIG